MILQAASFVGAYLSNDTWSSRHVSDNLKWMLYYENIKGDDDNIIVTIFYFAFH